jgi:hypothetical protein
MLLGLLLLGNPTSFVSVIHAIFVKIIEKTIMKKFLIVAITLIPFVIAHAESTTKPDVEKATTSEIIAPQSEQVKKDTVAEKAKVEKENTPKKIKMGKAGGKGG